MKKRQIKDFILTSLVKLSVIIVLFILLGIVIYTFIKGVPEIDIEFLTTKPSTLRKTVGILPFIINTLYLVVLSLVFAVPIGIFSAIYLQEYSKPSKIVSMIKTTIEVLAGIPSVVYGLFGFIFFNQVLGLGYSLLSGSFTLTIMILPTIIKTTIQSLTEVNKSYKEASLGLGATRLYTLKRVILPVAVPGIINGVILGIGRIVSESAALIYTAGIGESLPDNPVTHIFESGASLSAQLYIYGLRGEDLNIGYAIATVLIVIILIINIVTKLVGRKIVK